MTMATTVAERAAGLSRRYIVLLAVPVAAGFLPFLLSRELTQAIPAAAFVVFYGLLAVAAGASGIAWILHAARLALHTRPKTEIPLSEATAKQVIDLVRSEILHAETSRHVR